MVNRRSDSNINQSINILTQKGELAYKTKKHRKHNENPNYLQKTQNQTN